MPNIPAVIAWIRTRKVTIWLAQHLPMTDEEFSFTDPISGKAVNEYTERITGRPCLANYPWSFERVYQDTPLDELLQDIEDYDDIS